MVTNLKVYHYVLENPGKTFSQIVKGLNIHPSTIQFHLQKLIRERYIEKNKIDKDRYYENNQSYENKIIFALKNNKYLFETYSILDDTPLTLEEISSKVSISKSVASKRLKTLNYLGLAEKIIIQTKTYFKKSK